MAVIGAYRLELRHLRSLHDQHSSLSSAITTSTSSFGCMEIGRHEMDGEFGEKMGKDDGCMDD